MRTSSDTGQPILTDLEQYDADQAQNMLDAIAGFQETRTLHLLSGLRTLRDKYHISLSDAAINYALAALDEIYGDLFGSVWPDLANKAMSWDKRPRVSGEKGI